jgi:hypothetical protein
LAIMLLVLKERERYGWDFSAADAAESNYKL